jgi:hypothetical protein
MMVARQAEPSPLEALRTQELLAAEAFLGLAAAAAVEAAFECKFRTP